MSVIRTPAFSGNFDERFGGTTGTDQRQKKDPAKLWLNVGYSVQTPPTEEGGEPGVMFVSLPFGIPLDTQEKLPLKGSQMMVNLRAAQNGLLEQINEAAAQLQPGEERIIGVADNGLSIQIRRVRDSVESVDAETNNFARTLKLVG